MLSVARRRYSRRGHAVSRQVALVSPRLPTDGDWLVATERYRTTTARISHSNRNRRRRYTSEQASKAVA